MASGPTCGSLRYVAAVILSLSCAIMHTAAQGICLDEEIRLVDGASVYEGRVEICFGGLWGTVCDDSWDNNDASVVCRQLGFTSTGARGLQERFFTTPFGEGTGPIYLDNVACTGSESHLANCSHPGIGNHNCDHFEDAGVLCAGPCSDGEVRLNSVNYRRVASGNFGRVEVCQNGTFSAVICDTLWDNTDATVLCRQLGHSPYGAIGVSGYTQFIGFSLDSLPDVLPGVNCTGSELMLQDCTNATSMCQIPSSVVGAGVVCQANTTLPSNCTNGDLRLVNGSTSSEGRLEICVNGAWGTVCGSRLDAAAVCQLLGFSTLGATTLSSFPARSGPIFLQDVICCGNESSLLECSHPNPTGIVTCDHTSDIAIRCGDPPQCSSGDVRVVDRSGISLAAFSGIVEVCVNHTYGAISHISWSSQDARVLCRQQGFSPYGAIPVSDYMVRFDSTPVPNFITNISCIGSELNLVDCAMDFIEAPRYNCEAINAAVACQVNGTQPSNCSDGDVRLVDGTASNEGRVEICFNSAWGTICDSTFTRQDAAVVCQQLGYSRINATGSVQFGSGTGVIFLGSVMCSGNEDHVLNCSRAFPIGIHQCTSHSFDAGVRCTVRENCTDGEVRLVGGQTDLEGRVEICFDGVWGTVCDDAWGINDASVVCRQLGFAIPGALGFLNALFGPGVDPILLDNVNCIGSESHLANCSHPGIGIEDCGHSEDAGVTCSGPCNEGAVRTISDGNARSFSGGGDIVGRVEICVGGMFGATICSDLWDNRDASVVCSQLGYSPYGAIAISNWTIFGGVVLTLLVPIGDCSGSESSLQNCPMAASSNETFVCSRNVNVGVICQGNATLRANCSDGDVRLVDGTASNEGRVEICFNSVWGTICDSTFTRQDAAVVCQQLGYSRFNATGSVQFGSGTGPIFLGSVSCSGNEDHILNCSQNFPIGIHQCTSHSFDAGAHCTVRENCTDGEVRLVGGLTDLEGRVEICFDGVWGTVCDDGWDINDASVVCRQLGFLPLGVSAFSSAEFGPGVDPIFLDGVVCTGSESHLANCSHQGIWRHDCDHFMDAGVRCIGPVSENCTDGEVRLVGGQTELEGRVEICFGGVWGTVCNDFWDINDASVVCRQLGFPPLGAQAPCCATFGEGNGPILLDNVGCIGSESHLANCSHQGIGIHDCGHFEDAGVICSGPCSDGEIRTRRLARSLSTYVTGTIAQLEFCVNGVLVAVCDPFWDNTEASVLCRQLGFSPYGALAISNYSDVFGITGREGSLTALTIDCAGSESSLQSCPIITGASFQCGRRTDVGVVCQGNNTLPSNCTDGDIRLGDNRLDDIVFPDGGDGAVAGRVEICFNNAWGTVCSSGFGDQGSAAVVCQQLGFSSEGARVISQQNRAPASVPIFLTRTECCGFEASLTECSHRYPIGVPDCTHFSDLNVQCSTEDLLVEGSGSTCVEGNVQVSDIGLSNISPILLATNGGRLGRVEVCVNGSRVGISGDSWDNVDASVLCRQLGLSLYGASAIDDYGQLFSTLFTVVADGVNCVGSEQTIQECLMSTSALSCSRNYAGVVCQGNDTVPSNCADGELRLVNGSAPTEGRVEICFNNAWGTVCSDDGISDSTVITTCRALGFSPFGGMGGLDFGSGSGPIFIQRPLCSGFEASVLDCFTPFPVGVHTCDHSSDVGIRCLELPPGSSAILRLSTLNLTTLTARFVDSEITPELVLSQIRVSITDSAATLPIGNSTTRGSFVDSDCRFVNPRRIDVLNFWLRIECNITEYPESSTTLEYVRAISDYLHSFHLLAQLELIFNSSQAVSATGFCDAETLQTFYWPETEVGQQVCLAGSTGQRTSRVCSGDRMWQDPQQGCVGGGFCISSRTVSSFNGSYTWERTVAGATVTQPCVFGPAVFGGQAWRQCGDDGIWREPNFTQCINRLPDINLIPMQDVQQNGQVYSVDIGRRFGLRCQSAGQYAGRVFWMYQNQEVPAVPVQGSQEGASGEEGESGRGIIFSGFGGPVSIQSLDFFTDPTRLYSVQVSENAAYLVTHPDYGVVLQVGGIYTCVAVNEFGNFTQDIDVNIRELQGRISYTIVRFSVVADFQQESLTVVNNYLLHLQTVFLDLLGITNLTAVQCKSVARRKEDFLNIWSRVDCNITSISSPLVDPIIQNLQSQNTVAPRVIGNSAITSDFGFCDYEITQTTTGSYTWNETEGTNKVSQGCALGPAMGIAVEDAFAERECNMFGEWESPDIDNCITIISRQFLDLQESITTEQITEENIEQITEDLSEIVTGAREEVDQTQENLAIVVNVFVRTAAAVSDRQTVVVVDEETVNNIVEIVDDLTVWPDAVLEQNSSRIIQSFETIATNLVEQENFTDVTIIEEDVVFVAARVPVQRLLTSGTSFTSSRGVNDTLNADTVEGVEDGLSPGQVASAILPATIFNQIRNVEDTDVEAIGVFFSLYEESSLFPIAEPLNNTRIGSPVVAATVAGRTFRDLPEPVIVLVRLDAVTDGNITARRCVSWNFTLAGGRGNWTTEGCQTLETDDNDVVMCSCNHLTNFACLVDICTRTGGCETSPGVALALDIISIIGVVLSVIGLVLTVITLLASKKLRQRDATKFHIQLCIALFCMLIVFVIGIDRTELYGGCVAVSALIQYFTLASVMWMGAEAVLMFQKLVIVFVRITTRYIIGVSFICWLAPVVPVVIPLAIDRDFMLTFDVMASPRFCFIGNIAVFFGAFLGPIFAILLFNAVIFVIVVVVLLRHSMNSRGRVKEQMSRAKAIRLLISIMGVMVLFGLTWVLAALTISEASLVFQILFAVFNSLQGFFIFLFFCVFSKDARDFWRQVLSCGHYKSGLSYPKVTSSADTFSKQRGRRTLPTTLGHSTLGASATGEYRSSEMDTSVSFANPIVAEKELPNTNSPTYEQVQKTNTEGRKRSVSIFENPYVDSPTQTAIKEFELHYKGPPAVTSTDALKYRWKREPAQSQGTQETETYELDFDESNTTEL